MFLHDLAHISINLEFSCIEVCCNSQQCVLSTQMQFLTIFYLNRHKHFVMGSIFCTGNCVHIEHTVASLEKCSKSYHFFFSGSDRWCGCCYGAGHNHWADWYHHTLCQVGAFFTIMYHHTLCQVGAYFTIMFKAIFKTSLASQEWGPNAKIYVWHTSLKSSNAGSI